MRFLPTFRKKRTLSNIKKTHGLKIKRDAIIKRAVIQQQTENTDSIGSYPISQKELMSLVSSPHKFVLLSTVFLENLGKSQSDVSEGLPLYKLMDSNTADFVKHSINSHVTRYEISHSESAFLFQALFDNFEWRTLMYYLITTKICEGETTVLRICEGPKQEVIVEKHVPFKIGLSFDLGKPMAYLSNSLKMTQPQLLKDLVSICDCRFDIEVNETEFLFRVKTSMPPIEDIQLMRDRYYKSLLNTILQKFVPCN